MKKLVLIGVLILAVIAAACGGDDPSGGSTDASAGNGHDMGSMEGSVMGEPAEAADAERTVEVVMLDELAYDPGRLEVSEGDVITFEIVNEGKAPHEFVIGNEAYQAEHEDEMADMDHGDGDGNALSLGPGESGSLTWRFTESGEVLYACHEPGHYDGGMIGTVAVG